jgi:SanA protein
VELYKKSKIKYVIISGDNSKSTYDEPTDMKNELVKRGIPESVIFLDYAGFRTFDSVIRAQKVFSQTEFTVISQQFHNERAIVIARHYGIKAIGYNAKDVTAYNGFKTKVREKFARVKLFLDFIIGNEPKFLGKKIEIPMGE